MANQFIYCPKCGTRNFADDKSCGVCKTELINTFTSSEPPPTKKSNYFVVTTLLIGIVFLYFITSKKEESSEKTSYRDNISQKASQSYSNSKGYLVSSVQDFKQKFNKFSSNNDLKLRVKTIDIRQGEASNTFQYEFNKNLIIMGVLNKEDNSIISLTMIGQGDGSMRSGSNIFLTMAGIIASSDPMLSANERFEILKELGLFVEENPDLSNLSGATIRNGTQYQIKYLTDIGIMFAASIPE